MFEWWIKSLLRQEGYTPDIRVIVVDFWAQAMPDLNWTEKDVEERRWQFIRVAGRDIVHVPPKPNIWNGPHRLTKEHWWACANQRNTAVCLCDTDWITFTDDVSVLLPGWLKGVLNAQRDNYIMFGSYRKVRDLVVEDGIVKSFTDSGAGHDSRWRNTRSDLHSCAGEWLFGCSLALPIQALLDINGWPEDCDSLSFEDVCTGVVLGNTNKYAFRYDRASTTFESEELHSGGLVMRREDWHFENGKPMPGGNGGNDCSHAILNIAKSSKRFTHYLGDGFGNISDLRSHVLAGGTFPIRSHPEHHFWTKQALKDL